MGLYSNIDFEKFWLSYLLLVILFGHLATCKIVENDAWYTNVIFMHQSCRFQAQMNGVPNVIFRPS